VILVGALVNLGPFGPPSLFLLVVVVAAAGGGLWSGLAAAVISFLGLNYFFTPPRHTFRVDKPADLVALFVFIGVGAIVGVLFARVVSERDRVERREEEMRLVNRFATRLLSAELSRHVLREVAGTLVGLMNLKACTVDVRAEPALSASAASSLQGSERAGTARGPLLDVPIVAGETMLGLLRVERSPGSEAFSSGDERLLEAVAGQLGLAMERRRSDLEARAARTGAEASDMRAALFSSVTHDLRTPLASIKAGITGLMDEHAASDERGRSELLSTVLEETERLNRLVDNILNLARARAGDIAIEKELTPFEDVVETVLSRLRRSLAAFDVGTKINQDLPPVWVDAVQMDQALTNIIENAARHAPAGSEIQVALRPWQAGIQIRVVDRGPGIRPEDRRRVFEPFYKRDTATGRAGSGLGLAIAHAVVHAHEGRIRIEGVPGGGTAVVIELPVGTTGGSRAPGASAESEAASS
jgi:two-component system sensor histidine kinase KdpD